MRWKKSTIGIFQAGPEFYKTIPIRLTRRPGSLTSWIRIRRSVWLSSVPSVSRSGEWSWDGRRPAFTMTSIVPSIGMGVTPVESRCRVEPIFTDYRPAIIARPTRWWFWSSQREKMDDSKAAIRPLVIGRLFFKFAAEIWHCLYKILWLEAASFVNHVR